MFNGRVILITGGSRGMGANHAKRFVEEGAFVYITDVLEAEGQQLAEALGPTAKFLRLDASNEIDWRNVTTIISQEKGKLDTLVNNAGVALYKTLDSLSRDEFVKVFEINQLSVFLGMKYCLPLLEKGQGASIINTSSVMGMKGSPGGYAYVSSKFGVHGLSECAALELAPKNIRVNTIIPGAIATPMLSGLDSGGAEALKKFEEGIPLGRVGDVNDISNMVLFLSSQQAKYITAAEFIIDGGSVSK